MNSKGNCTPYSPGCRQKRISALFSQPTQSTYVHVRLNRGFSSRLELHLLSIARHLVEFVNNLNCTPYSSLKPTQSSFQLLTSLLFCYNHQLKVTRNCSTKSTLRSKVSTTTPYSLLIPHCFYKCVNIVLLIISSCTSLHNSTKYAL